LNLEYPNTNNKKELDQHFRKKFVKKGSHTAERLCGSTYLTRFLYKGYLYGYPLIQPKNRLEKLKQDLDNGGCLGIGEIGLYHFEKTGTEFDQISL
jgi:hypothetical protein